MLPEVFDHSVHLPDAVKSLPHIPAIYLVYEGSRFFYVGLTTNLNRRWQHHHKMPAVIRRGGAELAGYQCKEDLQTAERKWIAELSPLWNKTTGGEVGSRFCTKERQVHPDPQKDRWYKKCAEINQYLTPLWLLSLKIEDIEWRRVYQKAEAVFFPVPEQVEESMERIDDYIDGLCRLHAWGLRILESS